MCVMPVLWWACSGAAGYEQQQLAAAWRAYLAWECSNPQKLSPPELAARVSLAYDQALMPLRFYPDVSSPSPPPLAIPPSHLVAPSCPPLVAYMLGTSPHISLNSCWLELHFCSLEAIYRELLYRHVGRPSAPF